MKYAFSTLACPAWTIEQVVDAALRWGYSGVELRLLDGEVIEPESDRRKVEHAVAACRAAALEICALDTSCRFNYADPQERARQIADLRAWVRLAQAVEVPLLRVFGGPDPPTGGTITEQEANAWVADALGQVAPLAEAAGVTVLLETHDAFSSARRVAEVIGRINSPRVAALWDSQHPYRLGETAEEVVEVLGARIRHVHVKDACRPPTEDAPWPLVLLGEGDVPVHDQLRLLAQQGYTGYISVEWEKKWHPEIPEPEIALPQHIAWLKRNAPTN